MNEIWVMTDPNGDAFAFDCEETAQKFICSRLKNSNAAKDGYLSYCEDFMNDSPTERPMSFYDYISDPEIANNYDFVLQCIGILTRKNLNLV